MSAKELYELILSKYHTVGESVICDLHKPCSKSRGCNTPSSHSCIDFDKVETEFNRNRSSVPSVDAVTYSGNKFCFIEIKGWKEFLKWNIQDIGKIQSQAQYDLKGKFETSRNICSDIAGTATLFDTIQEIFILVTDIDVNENAMQNLYVNLMSLASTASDWEARCNIALKNRLNSQITTVPKYYVNCKDLAGKLLEIARK